MALNSKIISPFIAAAVLAGEGVYDEVIQDCLVGLSQELGLTQLDKLIPKEVAKLQAMDDDAFDDYMDAAAELIIDKEAVLLICLDILAADRFIAIDEIENYYAFADVLGVKEEVASDIFDDYVDEVEDLLIEDDSPVSAQQ